MKKNKTLRFFENLWQGFASVFNAKVIEGTQWIKYHNTRCGHGFAGEDANALSDILRGRHVDKVGVSNELNGADRIVNGHPIQTKYYASAQESVNAAFDHGVYRYPGQKLEVPRDQYRDAVKVMAEKIRQGQVPGVSKPRKASSMVVKGSVTHRQAVQIARAGNIDSIWFDVKTQSVVCASVLGLSFVTSYAAMRYRGVNRQKAFKAAVGCAARNGAITLVSGVVAKQFLRTTLGRNVAVAITKSIRQQTTALVQTHIGKSVVRQLSRTVFGRRLLENAARGATMATKVARTNVITAAIAFIVTTIPDIVKCKKKRMSNKQLVKNSAVNAAGIAAGSGGTWVGATIGTAICPGIGTAIGGLLGGIFGGLAGSAATKKTLDCFIDDDAKLMQSCFENVVVELAEKYSLAEFDLARIFRKLNEENVLERKFFENAFQAGNGGEDTQRMEAYMKIVLKPYFAPSDSMVTRWYRKIIAAFIKGRRAA